MFKRFIIGEVFTCPYDVEFTCPAYDKPITLPKGSECMVRSDGCIQVLDGEQEGSMLPIELIFGKEGWSVDKARVDTSAIAEYLTKYLVEASVLEEFDITETDKQDIHEAIEVVLKDLFE